MAGAQACVNPEATGGAVPVLEDQRCNGSLHKKSLSQSGTEDSGGQRYSADPTIFLGERASREDTDEDGYMTPMKEKHSSGTLSHTQNTVKYFKINQVHFPEQICWKVKKENVQLEHFLQPCTAFCGVDA